MEIWIPNNIKSLISATGATGDSVIQPYPPNQTYIQPDNYE